MYNVNSNLTSIIVKGKGTLSVPPDTVIISMTVITGGKEYDQVITEAAEKTESIRQNLDEKGFEVERLKSTGFRVDTEYDTLNDNGKYTKVFAGYKCTHQLCLDFDLDNDVLSKAISAIAGGDATPEISLDFTVKDKATLKERVLRRAAKDARRNAEVLCDEMNVELGGVLSIDYSPVEYDMVSPTAYHVDNMGLRAAAVSQVASVSVNPDDIKISATAEFVWEINEIR